MNLQPSGFLERLREPTRRLVRGSFLRAPARAIYQALTASGGVSVSLNGRRLRFLPGSEPPLVAPSRDDRVAYLDYLCIRHFCDAIRPGSRVADVGAFRGTYSVLAAALVGREGHVTAFEPFEASRADLRLNLERNGLLDRVTICDQAVSDRSGESEFYSLGVEAMNSLVLDGITHAGDRQSESIRRQTVRTVDLDSYFAEPGSAPDVLKIDVEGAELAVLRGAESILRGPVVVLCELHPYAWAAQGHTAEDLRRWLAERGRVVVDLDTGEEIGEYDYGPVLLARAADVAGRAPGAA